MTIREFAAHLGVSDRVVSKWEAGGAGIIPRPDSQAILDTALGQAAAEVRDRFTSVLLPTAHELIPQMQGLAVASHKFIPAFIGPEAAAGVMTDRSVMTDCHSWLECSAMQVDHPEASSCVLYVFACGVAVFHLVQHQEPARLAEFAAWRYRTYEEDLPYAGRRLGEILDLPPASVPTPEYVLSAYWLDRSRWGEGDVSTALRLLCAPSVLVDRDAPGGPRPLDENAEASLVMSAFDHPDIVPFGVNGVSIGYAAWSGVSYFACAPERALSVDELIDCELAVQALWCYSRQVQLMIEEGRDPSMPAAYGWRFLRAADSRLTSARAQETSQHCLMRDAILNTSGLPARMRAARDALRDSGI